MSSNIAGLVPAPSVERWLPTAGLFFRKLYLATRMLQNPHGSDTDFTIKGVAQACEHQADGSAQRKNPSLLPPSTGITQPVVLLLRASLASQQIASAQSSGVTTVPRRERFA